jgi:hypothetical protein
VAEEKGRQNAHPTEMIKHIKTWDSTRHHFHLVNISSPRKVTLTKYKMTTSSAVKMAAMINKLAVVSANF